MKNAEGKLTKMWNLFESLGGSRRYGWCEKNHNGTYRFTTRRMTGNLCFIAYPDCKTWTLKRDGEVVVMSDGSKVIINKQLEK